MHIHGIVTQLSREAVDSCEVGTIGVATEPITIALAADEAYARQLAVTIAGISRHTAGRPHRIFVLNDGYEPALAHQVARSAGADVELRWIDAHSADLDDALLPEYLPPATLYRLRLEELLPATVERVVYIDTDVVVLDSLAPLWDRDLDGAHLGAVRDPVHPWVASRDSLDWRRFGLAPDLPYFNAGMMVVALDSWRADGLGARALGLMGTHRFRYGDQCALNIAVAGKWMQLEPRWNLQSGHETKDSLAWVIEPTAALEDALRAPAVIHYTSLHDRLKPWQPGSTCPHRDLWFEDLDRTAWAGWRPQPDVVGARNDALLR